MRIYARIKGRVQGIGYRYFVVELGKKLALTGWVKNLPDGDVEGEAQGPEDRIRDFLRQLETGHAWARVDHVHHETIPENKNESGFQIKF